MGSIAEEDMGTGSEEVMEPPPCAEAVGELEKEAATSLVHLREGGGVATPSSLEWKLQVTHVLSDPDGWVHLPILVSALISFMTDGINETTDLKAAQKILASRASEVLQYTWSQAKRLPGGPAEREEKNVMTETWLVVLGALLMWRHSCGVSVGLLLQHFYHEEVPIEMHHVVAFSCALHVSITQSFRAVPFLAQYVIGSSTSIFTRALMGVSWLISTFSADSVAHAGALLFPMSWCLST